MPARVRGSGLRQAKSRVPEVPEQEAGAAALSICRVGEERGDDPAIDAGGVGTVWVVRRRSRAGSLLAQRPGLGFFPDQKCPLRDISAFSIRCAIYAKNRYLLDCFSLMQRNFGNSLACN